MPLTAETGQSTVIQVMILRQLQRVNDRLDKVEEKFTGSKKQQDVNQDSHKLSTVSRAHKNCRTVNKCKLTS